MNMKDKLLVDFVENEIHPSLEGDVELLLKHSKHDHVVVKNLKQVRSLIKKSDTSLREEFVVNKKGERLIGEDFYTNLHSKIMSSIVKSQDLANPKKTLKLVHDASVASEPYQKKLWRTETQVTSVK